MYYALAFLTAYLFPAVALAAAPEGGAYGDDHKSSGGLPQLDLEWFPSQIFWLFIMFTIMYVAFSKKILPDIASTLDNREQHISNDLETAKTLTEEAEAVQKSYDEQLSDARQESAKIMKKLDADLKQKSEDAHRKLGDEAAAQISEVKKRLDAETGEALAQIETQISEISVMTAEQIAGVKGNAKDVQSLLKALSKPEAKAA